MRILISVQLCNLDSLRGGLLCFGFCQLLDVFVSLLDSCKESEASLLCGGFRITTILGSFFSKSVAL